MGTFFLHSGEPGLACLLPHLRIPHGTHLPVDSRFDAVIVWSHDKHVPEKRHIGITLNSAADRERNREKRYRRDLLECNGLKVEEEPHAAAKSGLKAVRSYIVPVFHLRALTVYHSSDAATPLSVMTNRRTRYREMPVDLVENKGKALMKAAVRAVYALGLDFGVVRLGLQPGGGIVIHDVNPTPVLNERMGLLLAEAINRYDEELLAELWRTDPPLLGTDPEFLLCRQDGTVVPACNYLDKEGKVGCDSIHIGDRLSYALAELRPDPSSEPRRLLANLMQTMHMAAQKIGDAELKWVAGGMPSNGYALGGHLHLSGIWLNSRLLRALDNYLALPLVMVEAASTKQRRPRYGFLGDFRLKSHGGFEYRSLPSWIVSPRIAKGVVALCRIIADDYRELHRFPLKELPIQRAYYEGSKDVLYETVQLLWEDLKRLRSYPRYLHYLQPLKEQIDQTLSWNEQNDLRIQWKIPLYERETVQSTDS